MILILGRNQRGKRASCFNVSLSYTGEKVTHSVKRRTTKMETRDGHWSIANSLSGELQKEVSVVYFDDFNKVLEAAQFLNDLDHANVFWSLSM